MAPVSRRSFLAGLIAAPVLGVLAPKVFRPYRVNQTTIAVDDTQWGGSYRVSLWDGDDFVKVVNPAYLGVALIVPSWNRRGKITETRFKFTGECHAGLADYAAQYEYGPKWWKHSQAQITRNLTRAGVVHG